MVVGVRDARDESGGGQSRSPRPAWPPWHADVLLRRGTGMLSMLNRSPPPLALAPSSERSMSNERERERRSSESPPAHAVAAGNGRPFCGGDIFFDSSLNEPRSDESRFRHFESSSSNESVRLTALPKLLSSLSTSASSLACSCRSLSTLADPS